MRRDEQVGIRQRRWALAFGVGALLLAGCPETQFPKEGAGQPGDRAIGKAPPGAIGACKIKLSLRPPIVNPALWENLPVCNQRTPRRYLRIGYSNAQTPDVEAQRRMELVLEAVDEAPKEADANTRMLQMLREVQRIAAKDPGLRPRLERASGRTFACDYAYLFETTSRAYTKVSATQDQCPAYAYDPVRRGEVCLFDMSRQASQWLTGAWSCLAFTETVGEGASCYRLCDYDDHCAAQVSCSRADFDLMLCAMGVCMPEEVAGFY